jgi:hypothetical protein
MSQTVTFLPVSNREDWDDTIALFDVDTGDALDLSAVTAITLTVWDEDSRIARISKSLGDGITIDDVTGGVVSIRVAASEMTALCAKNYPLRLSMVNGGATKDLILGILPVEDGGPI